MAKGTSVFDTASTNLKKLSNNQRYYQAKFQTNWFEYVENKSDTKLIHTVNPNKTHLA